MVCFWISVAPACWYEPLEPPPFEPFVCPRKKAPPHAVHLVRPTARWSSTLPGKQAGQAHLRPSAAILARHKRRRQTCGGDGFRCPKSEPYWWRLADDVGKALWLSDACFRGSLGVATHEASRAPAAVPPIAPVVGRDSLDPSPRATSPHFCSLCTMTNCRISSYQSARSAHRLPGWPTGGCASHVHKSGNSIVPLPLAHSRQTRVPLWVPKHRLLCPVIGDGIAARQPPLLAHQVVQILVRFDLSGIR